MNAANKKLQQYHARQLAALRKHLQYCAVHIPFYKQWLADQNLSQFSLESLADLQRLPLVSKKLIRSRERDFIGSAYQRNKLHRSYSSGSTGEPFASYFDSLAWYRKKFYLKLKARFACGMGFFQRVAILECESLEDVQRRNKKAWLTDPLLKIRVFSLFQDHSDLLKQLADFGPQNIYAYPSHLLELGQCMQKQAQLLPSVKRLFTSSEFLESGARDYICRQFNADLFDHYGCTELKEVAWECPEHGDYHVNSDDVLLEIVNDGRQCVDGEPGEVVLTDLRNKGMAFVRYQINDYGVKSSGSCACGYVGDSFRPLGGRASDNLLLADGSELSPYSLTIAVENTPGLIQYQLEQTSLSQLVVHALWQGPPQDEIVEKLVATLSATVGSSVQVSVRTVQQLNIEENGKFKVVKRSF